MRKANNPFQRTVSQLRCLPAAELRRSAADRTSAKSVPSGCETDGVRLGVLDGRERPSTPWEPKERRVRSSTVKKAVRDRCPPSRTPQTVLCGHTQSLHGILPCLTVPIRRRESWAAKERGIGNPGSRSQLAHFSLPVRPSSKRRR
jgi:hypothetical protein